MLLSSTEATGLKHWAGLDSLLLGEHPKNNVEKT